MLNAMTETKHQMNHCKRLRLELKKTKISHDYTGTRAKVDSLGEVIDTCVKCKKNPTNDISNWCEMCVRNIIL